MPITLNSSGTRGSLVVAHSQIDVVKLPSLVVGSNSGENICALAVLRIRQTLDVNAEIKFECGRASSNASIVIVPNKFAQHFECPTTLGHTSLYKSAVV